MATHDPVTIDELFGELIVPEDDRRWIVTRTKARCEKKLADQAHRNGIHYFLPQMSSKRVYQKRKVTFTKPMFPGYLFVCVDHLQKQLLAVTGLTAGFISVSNQEQLLIELRALRKIPVEKVEVGNQYWRSKGLEVEIVKGPMAGTRGIVESHDKLHELRLQVDILRQAVLVKVDPANLKVIGEFEVVESD